LCAQFQLTGRKLYWICYYIIRKELKKIYFEYFNIILCALFQLTGRKLYWICYYIIRKVKKNILNTLISSCAPKHSSDIKEPADKKLCTVASTKRITGWSVLRLFLEGGAQEAPPKRLQLSTNLHDVTSDILEDRNHSTRRLKPHIIIIDVCIGKALQTFPVYRAGVSCVTQMQIQMFAAVSNKAWLQFQHFCYSSSSSAIPAAEMNAERCWWSNTSVQCGFMRLMRGKCTDVTEVTRDRSELHNEEMYNSFSSPEMLLGWWNQGGCDGRACSKQRTEQNKFRKPKAKWRPGSLRCKWKDNIKMTQSGRLSS